MNECLIYISCSGGSISHFFFGSIRRHTYRRETSCPSCRSRELRGERELGRKLRIRQRARFSEEVHGMVGEVGRISRETSRVWPKISNIQIRNLVLATLAV